MWVLSVMQIFFLVCLHVQDELQDDMDDSRVEYHTIECYIALVSKVVGPQYGNSTIQQLVPSKLFLCIVEVREIGSQMWAWDGNFKLIGSLAKVVETSPCDRFFQVDVFNCLLQTIV